MTALVPCTDAHFAWMLGGEPPSPELRLPPGGVEATPVIKMLRALLADIRNTHPVCAWLMTDGEEVVGLCSFTRAADGEGIPYIGYGVAESRRGRGHATRAIRLMVIEVLRDPAQQAGADQHTREDLTDDAGLAEPLKQLIHQLGRTEDQQHG